MMKIKMVVENVLDFGMYVSDELGFNNGLNESQGRSCIGVRVCSCTPSIFEISTNYSMY